MLTPKVGLRASHVHKGEPALFAAKEKRINPKEVLEIVTSGL